MRNLNSKLSRLSSRIGAGDLMKDADDNVL